MATRAPRQATVALEAQPKKAIQGFSSNSLSSKRPNADGVSPTQPSSGISSTSVSSTSSSNSSSTVTSPANKQPVATAKQAATVPELAGVAKLRNGATTTLDNLEESLPSPTSQTSQSNSASPRMDINKLLHTPSSLNHPPQGGMANLRSAAQQSTAGGPTVVHIPSNSGPLDGLGASGGSTSNVAANGSSGGGSSNGGGVPSSSSSESGTPELKGVEAPYGAVTIDIDEPRAAPAGSTNPGEKRVRIAVNQPTKASLQTGSSTASPSNVQVVQRSALKQPAQPSPVLQAQQGAAASPNAAAAATAAGARVSAGGAGAGSSGQSAQQGAGAHRNSTGSAPLPGVLPEGESDVEQQSQDGNLEAGTENSVSRSRNDAQDQGEGSYYSDEEPLEEESSEDDSPRENRVITFADEHAGKRLFEVKLFEVLDPEDYPPDEDSANGASATAGNAATARAGAGVACCAANGVCRTLDRKKTVRVAGGFLLIIAVVVVVLVFLLKIGR